MNRATTFPWPTDGAETGAERRETHADTAAGTVAETIEEISAETGARWIVSERAGGDRAVHSVGSHQRGKSGV
jgi:hypothetical protein